MRKHTISNNRLQELKDLLHCLNLSSNFTKPNKENKSIDFNLLNEALTHSSAKHSFNYERLEFLGDAVLRLAASEFIERNFPKMNVGERSALRAQLVSDKWLAKLGRRLDIQQLLTLGPNAAKDSSARSRLEADATEALIGAIYECWGNLDPIHQWLTPHWTKESKKILSDPHLQNYKSALQEWSQGRNLQRPVYQIEERSFKHGDPNRFFCKVHIEGKQLGQGWGGSRRDAEQKSAQNALEKLNETELKETLQEEKIQNIHD